MPEKISAPIQEGFVPSIPEGRVPLITDYPGPFGAEQDAAKTANLRKQLAEGRLANTMPAHHEPNRSGDGPFGEVSQQAIVLFENSLKK